MIELMLKTARESIKTELIGASELTERIDKSFANACQMIISAPGKIIVCGIGKSGHIGRKISATLSSTGTSSFYMHPAEALHGDLGMVSPGDVVILISYSGFATEFIRIIPLLRSMKVGIIAFTGNISSPLGQGADFVINIHTNKESCPLGLAPTSSAVNTLIMGDALAMALMQAKNFGEDEYAKTHPAGNLGTRLLCRVSDIMVSGDKTPKITSDLKIRDALFELTRTGLGLVSVTDDEEKLIGVFTDGDLRRWLMRGGNIQENILQGISRNPKTLSVNKLATEALTLLHSHKISAAPVIDDSGFIIGAINIHLIHDEGIF
ncbi:KpsF/GutQ family sugar-phosphate isomerase [Sodalis sp. RH16]|uniref:KpsF/GutQ family sugar-phosphate isomerase n=1 Tax=Sodalis sp. RH16 TaxID=3394331 RepID=UPI0039B5EFB7